MQQLLLYELGVVEYSLQYTHVLTSESVLGTFRGIKNHRFIIWVWPGFSKFGHARRGYCHGQRKIKVFERERLIHSPMPFLELIKLYKNTISQNLSLLDLLAVKYF